MAATPPLTPDEFRRGMRRLAASVCVITTADQDGVRYGLTATAVTSVSAEPPTLLCCLNRTSHTFAGVAKAQRFAVNVLAADDDAVAHRFAGEAVSSDKFSAGDWITLATGAPVLRSAYVAFDCRVSQLIEVATHGLLIGEVQAVAAASDEVAALLYAEGGYGAFTARDARLTEDAA